MKTNTYNDMLSRSGCFSNKNKGNRSSDKAQTHMQTENHECCDNMQAKNKKNSNGRCSSCSIISWRTRIASLWMLQISSKKQRDDGDSRIREFSIIIDVNITINGDWNLVTLEPWSRIRRKWWLFISLRIKQGIKALLCWGPIHYHLANGGHNAWLKKCSYHDGL